MCKDCSVLQTDSYKHCNEIFEFPLMGVIHYLWALQIFHIYLRPYWDFVT